MELRLASNALCSAGTNTTKVPLIEPLATPRAKHSATSAQGTNRLIRATLGEASHSRQAVSRTGRLASAACRRQVPRRGGILGRYVDHRAGLQRPATLGQWRLC